MITNQEQNEENKLVTQNCDTANIKQQNNTNNLINHNDILQQLPTSDFDYFTFPPSIEIAEIHRQSYYLCPNKSLINLQQLQCCPCCNKQINKKKFNWLFGNLYEIITEEYGIAIPLYFSLIKLQIILFILVFGIYGIYFIYKTQELCHNVLNCDDQTNLNNDICNKCQFNNNYHFVAINFLKDYIENDNSQEYNYYQFATFIVFFINLHLPFFYDLLISYNQIKYWHLDPYNQQTEPIYSIYCRHVPDEFEPQQIFDLIQTKMKSHPNQNIQQSIDKLNQPLLDELIYIHDIREIKLMQQKREQLLLDIFITAQQIKELQENKEIQTFKTSQIKIYKSFQQEQLQINLQQSIELLDQITNQIKLIMGFKECKSFYQQQENQYSLRLQPLPFSKKALIKFKQLEIKQLILQTFKRSVIDNIKIKLKFIQNPKINDKIVIKNGLRINGLFWENIGIKSEDRISTKIKSVLTMIIALIILMVAYELIFLYVNDPEFKINKNSGTLNTAEKAAQNIFTILVPLITTSAVLIIIINQKKAKKNTFQHQERGFMHFLIVVNYWLVTFLPFLFTFEGWDGKNSELSTYGLVTLSQNKLIMKQIFHTFHIRFMKRFFQIRSTLKNYHQYFQGQLNQLITPPYFPQRSRNCNAMFSLTIGLCLIYICPLITLIAFFFNCYIYLYDRYTISHMYAIDKQFTISLFKHQVKVYSIAFYPIKIYLYMKLFWDYGWLIKIGIPICLGCSLILIIFRENIKNLIIFKIFKLIKQNNKNYIQQSYSKSYWEYIQNLKIDEQTKLSEKLINFRQK